MTTDTTDVNVGDSFRLPLLLGYHVCYPTLDGTHAWALPSSAWMNPCFKDGTPSKMPKSHIHLLSSSSSNHIRYT